MSAESEWVVDIKGECGDTSWEISVIRSDNQHGFKSYGWFDARKLLVSHNGGPCHWPIAPIVWQAMVDTAGNLAVHLNEGGSLDDPHGFV